MFLVAQLLFFACWWSYHLVPLYKTHDLIFQLKLLIWSIRTFCLVLFDKTASGIEAAMPPLQVGKEVHHIRKMVRPSIWLLKWIWELFVKWWTYPGLFGVEVWCFSLEWCSHLSGRALMHTCWTGRCRYMFAWKNGVAPTSLTEIRFLDAVSMLRILRVLISIRL